MEGGSPPSFKLVSNVAVSGMSLQRYKMCLTHTYYKGGILYCKYVWGGIVMEFLITETAMHELRNSDFSRFIRINPRNKTWGGISYEIVPGELSAEDNYYEVEELVFIISKDEEKLIDCLEIDYIEDWWGSEFVVISGY